MVQTFNFSFFKYKKLRKNFCANYLVAILIILTYCSKYILCFIMKASRFWPRYSSVINIDKTKLNNTQIKQIKEKKLPSRWFPSNVGGYLRTGRWVQQLVVVVDTLGDGRIWEILFEDLKMVLIFSWPNMLHTNSIRNLSLFGRRVTNTPKKSRELLVGRMVLPPDQIMKVSLTSLNHVLRFCF